MSKGCTSSLSHPHRLLGLNVQHHAILFYLNDASKYVILKSLVMHSSQVSKFLTFPRSPRFNDIQQDAMHTCIKGITTCFQRETTASRNWQKLSKLLSCRSYSGSCGIETSTTLSNEVTEVPKRTNKNT